MMTSTAEVVAYGSCSERGMNQSKTTAWADPFPFEEYSSDDSRKKLSWLVLLPQWRLKLLSSSTFSLHRLRLKLGRMLCSTRTGKSVINTQPPNAAKDIPTIPTPAPTSSMFKVPLTNRVYQYLILSFPSIHVNASTISRVPGHGCCVEMKE